MGKSGIAKNNSPLAVAVNQPFTENFSPLSSSCPDQVVEGAVGDLFALQDFRSRVDGHLEVVLALVKAEPRVWNARVG